MFVLLCGSDCFGVLDCEWCTVDSDGKTHLDKPYCALQKECFGGIVGAKSPYADGLGLMGEWVIHQEPEIRNTFFFYCMCPSFNQPFSFVFLSVLQMKKWLLST